MLAVPAYLTAQALARVLPAAAADRLAVACARVAFGLRPPAREALEANLERLLPADPRRVRDRHARAAFEHFARGVARFLAPGPAAGAVHVTGAEHLSAARASGRGVIVLSAHMGDWESGTAYLAAQGLSVHMAARAQRAAAIEAIFARRRAERGVRVLRPGAMFAGAASALRRGEWVALMADRGAVPGAGGSVCAWAAALARRTGAIVLPAVFVFDGAEGRPTLVVEPPLTPERCRDGAFRATLRTWLARWPGQWAAFEALPRGLA